MLTKSGLIPGPGAGLVRDNYGCAANDSVLRIAIHASSEVIHIPPQIF